MTTDSLLPKGKLTEAQSPDVLLARLDKKRVARLVAMLRKIALSQIWEDQGGCSALDDDGKWIIAGACVTLSPDDLDLAFELTGIAKQPIVSRGDCRTCIFSENGLERGYRVPCVSCKRPIMSNYEPRGRAKTPSPAGRLALHGHGRGE